MRARATNSQGASRITGSSSLLRLPVGRAPLLGALILVATHGRRYYPKNRRQERCHAISFILHDERAGGGIGRDAAITTAVGRGTSVEAVVPFEEPAETTSRPLYERLPRSCARASTTIDRPRRDRAHHLPRTGHDRRRRGRDRRRCGHPFKRYQPDVTLIDLRLGATSGIDAIQSIPRDKPDGEDRRADHVSGDEDIHQALKAGAATYLLKDASSTAHSNPRPGGRRGHTVDPDVRARLIERAAQPR